MNLGNTTYSECIEVSSSLRYCPFFLDGPDGEESSSMFDLFKLKFVNPLFCKAGLGPVEMNSVNEFAFRVSLISYPGHPESLAYAIGMDTSFSYKT